MSTSYQRYLSPVGDLYLVESDAQLIAVLFSSSWKEEKKKFSDLTEVETPLLRKAKKQLTEYFSRKRKDFDLPYRLTGTDFQNLTWSSLGKIPFGETRSYAEQARVIKSPRAVRAVGRTNGLNPLAIILPCHRVIGSNRALTGYAGGLDIKEFLLKLEGIDFDPKGRIV